MVSSQSSPHSNEPSLTWLLVPLDLIHLRSFMSHLSFLPILYIAAESSLFRPPHHLSFLPGRFLAALTLARSALACFLFSSTTGSLLPCCTTTAIAFGYHPH